MTNGSGEEAGYAMGALLVAVAAMSIMMSVALPVWNQIAKREREAELVFRGEQYARAVELYQRTYAAAYPEDIETLIDERFLRERYRDPMTEDGEFRVVYEAEVSGLLDAAPTSDRPGPPVRQGGSASLSGRDDAEREDRGGSGRDREGPRLQLDADPPPAGRRGGVVGVVSRSDEESLMIYNGATKYSEWVFVHASSTADPGLGLPGDDPGGGLGLGFGQGPIAPRQR